jgi:hypothetical protein
MTETQELILEGTEKMYEESGEMVPTVLFNSNDLKVLVDEGKITIVDNPYGVGDNFFGLKGKEYPKTFSDLMEHRLSRN